MRRPVFLAFVLAGCAVPQREAPRPSPAQLGLASARDPALSAATLDEGRTLFIVRCGSCHARPDPAGRPPAEWPNQVSRMSRKARLSNEEAARITTYLQVVSEASEPKVR